MKVVHLITGLNVGGAERMLQKLLGALDRDQFDPVVVTLMSGGDLKQGLVDDGVPVFEIGLPRGVVTPRGLWKIRSLARKLTPDLIQGWMYHSNLAADLMARFTPGQPDLWWNVRHSAHDLGLEKWTTRAVINAGARLSGRPRGIIFNSRTSLDQHTALGYQRAKCQVIPNGFDTAVFRPDPAARQSLRGELGLADSELLVGMVGRLHPHKGQFDFLAAVERVSAEVPEVHFVMAGSGVTDLDRDLRVFLRGKDFSSRVHLLGPRSDIPRLMAGLDLLCLSSVTEAFPNVLGEAMSCGIPCVSTDVGDAARIIGKSGLIVPAGNPPAMADGIRQMLEMDQQERQTLGEMGRQRVRDHFSLTAVVRAYEKIYRST